MQTSRKIKESSGWTSTQCWRGLTVWTLTGILTCFSTARVSSTIGKRKTCSMLIHCHSRTIRSTSLTLLRMPNRQLQPAKPLSAGWSSQNFWSCTRMDLRKKKRIQEITWRSMCTKTLTKAKRSLKTGTALKEASTRQNKQRCSTSNFHQLNICKLRTASI